MASEVAVFFHILCILFSFQGTVFICKSSVFIRMYLPFFHAVSIRVFGQSPPLHYYDCIGLSASLLNSIISLQFNFHTIHTLYSKRKSKISSYSNRQKIQGNLEHTLSKFSLSCYMLKYLYIQNYLQTTHLTLKAYKIIKKTDIPNFNFLNI